METLEVELSKITTVVVHLKHKFFVIFKYNTRWKTVCFTTASFLVVLRYVSFRWAKQQVAALLFPTVEDLS